MARLGAAGGRSIDSPIVAPSALFRDGALFDHLRGHVLPELVERARRRGSDLRLWCAGCGTGEEAYTLALLVAEALGDGPDSGHARIFATDADPSAIAIARKGVYAAEAIARVPGDLRARHVATDGQHVAVRAHVRRLLIFGEHDLLNRAAFPDIDLVLCRAAIATRAPTVRRRAIQLFAFALVEGGYLVLDPRDALEPSERRFQPSETRLGLYRRTNARGAPSPPGPRKAIETSQPSRRAAARARGEAGPAEQGRRSARAPTSSDRLAQVFARLSTGVVVLDRARRVRTINSAARAALGAAKDAENQQLLELGLFANPAGLRGLLDAVYEGRGPARLDGLELVGSGESPRRTLSVTATALVDDDAAIDVVVLRIEESPAVKEGRQQAARLGSAPAARRAGRAPEQAASRAREPLAIETAGLVAENTRLREANERLTVMHADTAHDNERLLVRIAEAEAAAAQVGALNQELAVTVDELEMVNEALGATMEELRTTNEDLETQRVRLDAALSGLSDALVVIDRGARAVLFNAAYERLFAAPASKLRLRDAHGRALAPGEAPWRRAANGEPFVQEFSASTDQGERRFEAIGKTITVDAEPEEVVLLRDVTDRAPQSVEEELFKEASHQLRTPLTSLQGSLDRIARLLPSTADERIKNYAAIASAQTHQLTRLSSDLLDAARLRTGTLQIWRTRVDLADLARRAVESIRPLAPGQQIRVDASAEPLEVEGDPDRIEQVVMNLLVNAISHAPDSDRIDVRVCRRRKVAELQVQDYGEGVPPELAPHLFTRIARSEEAPRRKGSGLGLGLYLSKEIVEAHGGTISLESTPGHGATFTVRLPIRGEPTTSP